MYVNYALTTNNKIRNKLKIKKSPTKKSGFFITYTPAK